MTEVLSEVISDDQAATELFNAIQDDTGRSFAHDTALEPETQESNSDAATPAEGEAQEDATTAEAADTFTKLDPNAIPDEMRPWYESMQADYTRKTQQLAEVRKGYESLGEVDPTEAQAALTLFQTLQDPQGALDFHQRLSSTLEQMGLTPAQAAAEATRQIAQETVDTPSWEDDPDSALKAELDGVKNTLAQFQADFAQREEALRQQEYQAAVQAEMHRQESLIREANPHYNDSDVNAVYELAAFHRGNLLQAQARYEDIVSERVNRLMATKASAAQTQGVQAIAPATTANEAPSFGDDLEAAHRAAQEVLRAISSEA